MMNKKSNISVRCEKANHVCDKSQYKEASLWEKIKLTIHLVYCKACRGYSKKNNKLTELVDNSSVDCLELKEKAKMKSEFNREFKNHQ